MIFKLSHSEWFAAISLDNNRMHLDPVFAKTELYGRVVAHGVHAVFALLNEWMESSSSSSPNIKKLSVRFIKPVYLEKEYNSKIDRLDDGRVRLNYESASQGRVLEIFVEVVSEGGEYGTLNSSAREYGFSEEIAPVDGASFSLRLERPSLELCQRYPQIGNLPDVLCQFLLASTYVVGVICPGRQSVFSELEIDVVKLQLPSDRAVTFDIANFDSRFSRVKITTDGFLISAFVRPSPTHSLPIGELPSQLRRPSLNGLRALVLGASRGLGLTLVKSLLKSGSTVVAVARSINEEMECLSLEYPSLTLVPLDCANGVNWVGELASCGDFELVVNMLSPRIADDFHSEEQKKSLFRHFYIDVTERVAIDLKPVVIASPSTIFVEERVRGMETYSEVKLEMEEKFSTRGESKIVMPRLPRIASDQNHSIIKYPALSLEDGAALVLDEIEKNLTERLV